MPAASLSCVVILHFHYPISPLIDSVNGFFYCSMIDHYNFIGKIL